MNNVFNHLPIAFPFYQDVKSQDIYKENIDEDLLYQLITPSNCLLPFQIRMPVDSGKPIKWEIISNCGDNVLDVSNNLNLVKVYNFDNYKQAVYFGAQLQFVYQTINNPLDLPCGYYYTKFTFLDGSYYVSEIFRVEKNLQNFIKVEFWCENDLNPIIYRDNWKQILYLPTFVHTAMPEIEEESLKDGYNNEIPIYQKMVLKYKFVDIVPDFLKTALISLQMQDFVYLWISETRQGLIDRVWVSVTPDDTGATNEVEVMFEDDVLLKTKCNVSDVLQNTETW